MQTEDQKSGGPAGEPGTLTAGSETGAVQTTTENGRECVLTPEMQTVKITIWLSENGRRMFGGDGLVTVQRLQTIYARAEENLGFELTNSARVKLRRIAKQLGYYNGSPPSGGREIDQEALEQLSNNVGKIAFVLNWILFKIPPTVYVGTPGGVTATIQSIDELKSIVTEVLMDVSPTMSATELAGRELPERLLQHPGKGA